MKSLKINFYKIFLILVISNITLCQASENTNDTRSTLLKVGYFHGGRTMLMYRALISNYFEIENLNVVFISKNLRSKTWIEYSNKNSVDAFNLPISGKATGLELIDLMTKGQVDVAFVGESAFVKSCAEGMPILAIGELGHDEKKAGHAIVIQKNLKISSPKDLEKIVWGTRRSSGGDDIFLKEFLLNEGADITKVKMISGIDDDKIGKYFKENKIQGAYYHLMSLRNDYNSNNTKIYRKLDWVNPQLSHALIVVNSVFFKKNRDILKMFIKAYLKKINDESKLSLKERSKKDFDKKTKIHKKYLFEIETNFKGMNLPQYSQVPLINKDLETESMELFYKHKFIPVKINVENCIDNSLMEEASSELYTK